MRSLVKAVFERGMVATGLAGLLGRMPRATRVVLAYHNIVPEGEALAGDASLHLGQRAFAAQLDLLQRHTDVLPLAELLGGKAAGKRPQVALTFDDAYRGALTVGIDELRNRGMPATMFVAPGCLGGRAFWWDTLAGSGGIPLNVRRQALEECSGREEEVLAWATQTGLANSELCGSGVSATVEELRGALEYSGLSLGSHTWGHPNLPRLMDDELADELFTSMAWLRERFGARAGSWLAYPYGSSEVRVERAAEVAGYSAAFRVDGGWLPSERTGQFGLPRLNVPAGLSIDGFQLRLAGMFCR